MGGMVPTSQGQQMGRLKY